MTRNKILNGAIPALLIHCSIGTVYCWSTFKDQIAQYVNLSPFAVGWAFSIAIFFLGMSAAFGGRYVERDIHKSSLVAAICFSGGMIGTGLSILLLKGIPALIGIYLSYGVLMGIGLGIGYLSPVKTLMLWFKDNKGLATGISIAGFGLAKAIATPIMTWLLAQFGIWAMFLILGGFYFIIMMTGHFLLEKPIDWVESKEIPKFSLGIFKNRYFRRIWLIFFINIHCGLMLISYETQIINIYLTGLAAATAIIPMITALFNAGGRIGYSTLSDHCKTRKTIYQIIFISCIFMLISTLIFRSSAILPFIIVLLLLVVNAGYGGGFSTLPALLTEYFGLSKVSEIHGLALSAWAIAGLTGNNTTAIILQNGLNYEVVFCVALVLYSVALIVSSWRNHIYGIGEVVFPHEYKRGYRRAAGIFP